MSAATRGRVKVTLSGYYDIDCTDDGYLADTLEEAVQMDREVAEETPSEALHWVDKLTVTFELVADA